MTSVRRRILLTLPLVGPFVWWLAGCAGPKEVPPMPQQATGPKRFVYGEDPSQYGELSLPGGDPRGVAVVVHGGFWRAAYGIEYAQPLVPSLVEQGWATWAIEYRRVGSGEGAGGGVPQTLDDVAAALDHLAALHRAGDLPTDPSRVPVVGIGHSAGGHLVTWAGAGGVLTHVVSQAGVLDLVAGASLGGGAVAAFLGHEPGPGDADVDPIRMVPLEVPVWCVHAQDDDVVPFAQSQAYVDAATSAGATAELRPVRSGGHFTLIDPDSEAWSATLEHLDTITQRT
ncbi:alpha/beta hydrolase [Nocardioides acrostichi]|uniref:Prolyl oligopeptidase family serine peptidase n=1 Tax=Nocardioides acrostichi TaxID=2784339 RepID=A0A930YBN5_9ACTN|nr:alpha/beta hydrolase [Nocardioides acrostichi]MBF4162653.1 prolyl oligopeptidase family serine peptidase [Nocardioides acrostichi]